MKNFHYAVILAIVGLLYSGVGIAHEEYWRCRRNCNKQYRECKKEQRTCHEEFEACHDRCAKIDDYAEENEFDLEFWNELKDDQD